MTADNLLLNILYGRSIPAFDA